MLYLGFAHICTMKKVLVGILYSGESEYEMCIQSLQSQTLTDWDMYEIKNQTKKVAHDTLYAYFMSQAQHYQYFLKLDADMVFSHPSVLQEMVDYCQSKDLAHLMSYVHDCPSGVDIPGIQMYRSDCAWQGSNDLLNTDYAPKVFGAAKSVMDKRWIDHMPQSTDYQLFRYGIHKALKSLQPDRTNKSIPKFLMHLTILQGIARNALANPETGLFYSLIGATLVAEGRYKQIEHNTDEAKRLFEKLQAKSEVLKSNREYSEEYWRNPVQSAYKWYAQLTKK